MDEDTYDQLALALLYFRSWREYEGTDYRRAWKGFDFDALDRLEAKGYLTGKHRNKSVYITPEGIARAREVIAALDEGLGDGLHETDKSHRGD